MTGDKVILKLKEIYGDVNYGLHEMGVELGNLKNKVLWIFLLRFMDRSFDFKRNEEYGNWKRKELLCQKDLLLSFSLIPNHFNLKLLKPHDYFKLNLGNSLWQCKFT